MACEDTRQLTEAQRQAAYQQQRTGVQRAIRPFTGNATLPNLIDYINRELMPAVKAARSAVNDVYLQVADNAPSANPLGYFFSTETGAADPTTGRVRLNQATQNTSTVLRISQTNGRLTDVLPWLEVMSGSVTEPLGVVTLADAVNPGRFLRADLDTMTDQGAYWDLGITITESSHPNPFVEGEGVTLAFIPGVADNEGVGAQIPPGSISPIASDTFLGNISGSAASPSAVPLADVDSTSVVYDAASHTFQRAALTGFAVAAANSNATTSAEPIVTFSASSNMSNERVLSNGTGTTVDIGTAGQVQVDLADMAAGTVKGRQIDAGTGAPVDLTGNEVGEILRMGVEENITVSGAAQTPAIADTTTLADFGSTGDLTGLTLGSASQNGRLIFFKHTPGGGTTTTIKDTASAGAVTGIRTPGQVDFVIGANAGGLNLIQGFLYKDPTDTDGRLWLFPRGHSRAEDIAWTGNHSFTSTTFTVTTTGDVDIASGDDLRMNGVAGATIAALAAGLPTAPAAGTLDLRADSSVRVITAGVERIEYEDDGAWQLGGSTGTLGHTIVNAGSSAPPAWGQLPTAGLADAAVTLAKMANLAAGAVIGRQIDAGSGVPVALTGGEVAEIIRWGNVVTESVGGTFNDHALDTLTDSWVFTATSTITGVAGGTTGRLLKIRNATAGSVTIANTSGSSVAANQFVNPSGAAVVLPSGHTAIYFYEASRWRCYGVTIDADGSVTLAKLANLAQSTIIGRAEGAGTGVPQALTPTQVVSIIDGESPTWTGSHTFNGESFTVTTTGVGDISLTAGDDVTIDAGGSVLIDSGTASIVLTPGTTLKFEGPTQALSSFAFQSVITPTALSADQNDYTPTGWSTANVVRLSCNSATDRAITGAAAGADGEIKWLFNVGTAGQIQLKHEDTNSTAANRFLFASLTTFNLDPHGGAAIWYDGTSDRWRAIMPNIVGTLP